MDNGNNFGITGYNVSINIEKISESFLNEFSIINRSKLNIFDSDDTNSQFSSEGFSDTNHSTFYKRGELIKEFDLKFDSPENFWIILKSNRAFNYDFKEWCLDKNSHFNDDELKCLKKGTKNLNFR